MQGSISWSQPQAVNETGLPLSAALYHATNLLVFNISVGFLYSEFGVLSTPLAAWGVLTLAVLAYFLPRLTGVPFSPAKVQGVAFAIIYALVILAADLQHGLSVTMLAVLVAVAVSAWCAPSRLQMTRKAVILASLLSVGLVFLPVGLI